MKKSTLNLFGSLLFLAVAAGAFFYVWSAEDELVANSGSTQYNIVDISGIKAEAQKIIGETENYAGLPISDPSSKVGKTNPFVSAE